MPKRAALLTVALTGKGALRGVWGDSGTGFLAVKKEAEAEAVEVEADGSSACHGGEENEGPDESFLDLEQTEKPASSSYAGEVAHYVKKRAAEKAAGAVQWVRNQKPKTWCGGEEKVEVNVGSTSKPTLNSEEGTPGATGGEQVQGNGAGAGGAPLAGDKDTKVDEDEGEVAEEAAATAASVAAGGEETANPATVLFLVKLPSGSEADRFLKELQNANRSDCKAGQINCIDAAKEETDANNPRTVSYVLVRQSGTNTFLPQTVRDAFAGVSGFETQWTQNTSGKAKDIKSVNAFLNALKTPADVWLTFPRGWNSKGQEIGRPKIQARNFRTWMLATK
eukprot:g19991.t1